MSSCSEGENLEKKKEFETSFKNSELVYRDIQSFTDSCTHTVWADNADYCAIQYAGTGALKTDFTRLNIIYYL